MASLILIRNVFVGLLLYWGYPKAPYHIAHYLVYMIVYKYNVPSYVTSNSVHTLSPCQPV